MKGKMTVGDHKRGETERGSGRSTVRRRPNRRRLVKAGIAVAGGVALSTTYVKPAMLSIAVHETAYASGKLGDVRTPPAPIKPEAFPKPGGPTPRPTASGGGSAAGPEKRGVATTVSEKSGEGPTPTPERGRGPTPAPEKLGPPAGSEKRGGPTPTPAKAGGSIPTSEKRAPAPTPEKRAPTSTPEKRGGDGRGANKKP
jgi:hypothetical protein